MSAGLFCMDASLCRHNIGSFHAYHICQCSCIYGVCIVHRGNKPYIIFCVWGRWPWEEGYFQHTYNVIICYSFALYQAFVFIFFLTLCDLLFAIKMLLSASWVRWLTWRAFSVWFVYFNTRCLRVDHSIGKTGTTGGAIFLLCWVSFQPWVAWVGVLSSFWTSCSLYVSYASILRWPPAYPCDLWPPSVPSNCASLSVRPLQYSRYRKTYFPWYHAAVWGVAITSCVPAVATGHIGMCRPGWLIRAAEQEYLTWH